jgi:hypothetical protein
MQMPEPDRQPPLQSWLDLARILTTTKRGAYFLTALFIAIGSFVLISMYILRPDIQIVTGTGTIIIKTGNTQKAALMVSAAGGREGNLPWSGTGIMVKKNDKVKIEASGQVHTSLNKLIAIAQTDHKIVPAWVGPEGSKPSEEGDWDDARNDYKLFPDHNGAHYGYGMLIAAVRNGQHQVIPDTREPIGEKHEFPVQADGELVLAVNDILLDSKAEKIYALPNTPQFFQYYVRKAEEDALLKRESTDWSETVKREKAYEQYQKRLDTWKEIFEKNNWLVWYDDNVGAFSVSVAVN